MWKLDGKKLESFLIKIVTFSIEKLEKFENIDLLKKLKVYTQPIVVLLSCVFYQPKSNIPVQLFHRTAMLINSHVHLINFFRENQLLFSLETSSLSLQP
jgi:hypothetical protein